MPPEGRGVDVCFDGVGGDVTMESLRCLARNGRHLVIGFASGIEAEEIPIVNGRTLCFGNFSLVGVILAYSDPALLPPGSGFNPTPPQVGDEVQAHLVELLRAGRSGRWWAGSSRSSSCLRPSRRWRPAPPWAGSSCRSRHSGRSAGARRRLQVWPHGKGLS